jgi:hypothetical protein
MDAIKPVWRDFVGVDPLKKYFHGKTQNPNESVVSCLDKAIQNYFVRLDTLKFAVYDAVLCFNDDVVKKNDVLNILGLRSGSNR